MAVAGSINVLLSAQTDKFGRDMARAGKSTDALGASLGKFQSIAAKAFGLFAAGSLIGRSVQAFAEQETAVKRLNSVLDATKGAAGISSEGIQAFATQLQQTTRFADETTIAAASLLATFDKVKGGSFTRALSTAADVATIKGMPLDEATALIGKALQAPADSFGKLKKAGIVFDEQLQSNVKHLVAMGQTAQAQTVILDEFAKRFGGAAANDLDTYAGRLENLKNNFGELQETVGKFSVGALNQVLGPLAEFTQYARFASGSMSPAEREAWLNRAPEVADQGPSGPPRPSKFNPVANVLFAGTGGGALPKTAGGKIADAFAKMFSDPGNKIVDRIGGTDILTGLKKRADEQNKLAESLRTPEQIFNKEVFDLKKALRQGVINQDEFGRGVGMARQRMDQKGFQPNEALMAGSAEAITARIAADAKMNDPVVKELKEQKGLQAKQLQEAEKQTRATQAVENFFKGSLV